MARTHFDPMLNGSTLTTEVPLHKTAYSGGVNGIIASNHVAEVDCAICIRRMSMPEYSKRFTFEELEVLRLDFPRVSH